jgi:hypothetical protein
MIDRFIQTLPKHYPKRMVGKPGAMREANKPRDQREINVRQQPAIAIHDNRYP